MMIKTILIIMLTFSIWGNIADYTDGTITIYSPAEKEEKGKTETFIFTDNVTIDTYSLEKNDEGNVRIEINESGQAERVYFYGIDMPDVINIYKNGGKRR